MSPNRGTGANVTARTSHRKRHAWVYASSLSLQILVLLSFVGCSLNSRINDEDLLKVDSIMQRYESSSIIEKERTLAINEVRSIEFHATTKRYVLQCLSLSESVTECRKELRELREG